MIRSVSDGFRKFYFTKAEMILRTMPRFTDAERFEKGYNQYLDTVKSKGNFDSNIAKFPIKTFNKFPKSSMERLIKASYDVLKSNNKTNTIFSYNSVITSYLMHEINFDISSILNDMVKNNVKFNDSTYGLLISFYSERADMIVVENVIEAMKTNGVSISEGSKCAIYGGYIRAKQFNKAEEFMKNENIATNNVNCLIHKCKAYADIDHFKELLETLQLIEAVSPGLPSKISLNLYERLVKAMAPDSEVDKIFSMANLKEHQNLVNLIFNLNSNGFYNHSLKLMLKMADSFSDNITTLDVIKSFCTRDCPSNIYITVLETFTKKIFPNAYLNLFANVDFDTALKMCERVMNSENEQCIISNLLIKAINDQSFENIGIVFQLMESKLLLRNFNVIIQHVFIPNMVDSKIVSHPEELLKFLPYRKKQLLPPLFMHYLCKGDFNSMESLMTTYETNFPLRYTNFSRSSAKNILNNVPFKEIEKIVAILSKVFSPQFVNWLSGSIVLERVFRLSVNDNIDEINESVKVAKRLGITYESRDIIYLDQNAPKYRHLFSEMELKEERPNEEHADVETNISH